MFMTLEDQTGLVNVISGGPAHLRRPCSTISPISASTPTDTSATAVPTRPIAKNCPGTPVHIVASQRATPGSDGPERIDEEQETWSRRSHLFVACRGGGASSV